jgi:hypothetical protein
LFASAEALEIGRGDGLDDGSSRWVCGCQFWLVDGIWQAFFAPDYATRKGAVLPVFR